jgi:hypothetical protein
VSTPDSVVATFAGKGPIGWSPSGRYLALEDGSVWDSKSERKTLAVGGARKWTWSPRADCLLGMTAQGTLVVAIPGKPQKVLADGISSFTFAEGGRFLAVGGGREPNLALDLRKNRTFDYPRRVPGSNRCRVKAPYTSPTCSPDGRFVAAIRDGKLVLLQNGGSARGITEGPYLDAAPEWGPPRSGILFLRLPEGETDAEVWFFPEGGTVRRTPLVVPGARSVLSSKDFTTDGVIDWSATPPSGVPF